MSILKKIKSKFRLRSIYLPKGNRYVTPLSAPHIELPKTDEYLFDLKESAILKGYGLACEYSIADPSLIEFDIATVYVYDEEL